MIPTPVQEGDARKMTTKENTMDKLKMLMERCKCGVHLTVNDHRNVYETAEQALENLPEFVQEIAPEVRAKIIETDTLIDLHFYPDTPIGFYKVLHHDLDAALDEALAAVGLV
jgi:hypothetical protein